MFSVTVFNRNCIDIITQFTVTKYLCRNTDFLSRPKRHLFFFGSLVFLNVHVYAILGVRHRTIELKRISVWNIEYEYEKRAYKRIKIFK